MSCQAQQGVVPLQQTSPYIHQGSVISRQKAESRLYTLTPGTEEHSQLQNALIKTAGIVEIHPPSITYKVNTSPENDLLKGGFGASEHVTIGEAVKLKGLSEENPSLFIKGVTKIYGSSGK